MEEGKVHSEGSAGEGFNWTETPFLIAASPCCLCPGEVGAQGRCSNSCHPAWGGCNSAGQKLVCLQAHVWDITASFGKENTAPLNNLWVFLNYSIIGAHSLVLRSQKKCQQYVMSLNLIFRSSLRPHFQGYKSNLR